MSWKLPVCTVTVMLTLLTSNWKIPCKYHFSKQKRCDSDSDIVEDPVGWNSFQNTSETLKTNMTYIQCKNMPIYVEQLHKCDSTEAVFLFRPQRLFAALLSRQIAYLNSGLAASRRRLSVAPPANSYLSAVNFALVALNLILVKCRETIFKNCG